MPRILLVIAPYDFNDKQLAIVASMLIKAGAQIVISNSTGQTAKGERGSVIRPDADFYHVDSRDFDGIVFIGGIGSAAYQHNRRAHQLAKEFFEAGKIVGAIGLSPTILASAQILGGKRTTGRPTERDMLNAMGQYTGAPVEVDGNIITALSTAYSAEFTNSIIMALSKR